MYLKKLEIQGFKSMADKIELDFNPGVSAIVGPNGSGKSNIADAMRWVLGEQSVKSLRGAKMEDIIFAGSDKRKPVGMAEVSMTLDNSLSVFPLDFSEITVTRRVYRSGDSEYLINKSPCRLRDIHELFMDTGVGREGYSIIGQGKIEEILSAKSEDRRVIIEEAAGIIKYKSRKLQAARKLEDTEQNLVRIHDIIAELELQLGPLEEQSQRAKQFLEYREELDELEINMLINQIEEQKVRLAEMMEGDESLNRAIIESETGLRNLESEVEAKRFRVNQLDEEITELQKAVYTISSRIEKTDAEIMVTSERRHNLVKQKENLTQEIAELAAKEANEKLQHADDLKNSAELKGKIKTAEKNLSEIEGQLAAIEAALASDQQEIEEKKAVIIDLLNEIAGVNNSVSTIEADRQNAIRRIAQVDQQDESLGRELEAVMQREAENHRRLDGLTTTLDELTGQEKEISRQKRDSAEQISKLSGAVTETRQQLQEKSSRLKALQDLQNDYEGYFRGVREVLKEGREGSCSGICGVVAELIKAPEKYETAVEVALGGAMQHIVTENEDDARHAIEFLKRTKAGRATFLPLTTIKPYGKDKIDARFAAQQGCHGVAADLVTCEAKYAGIIGYLLGRVHVVDNIRDATELAKKNNFNLKIVTLDGDVVNPGGSMTGGSYQKNRSSLLGRSREIEELGTLKQKLQGRLTGLEKELALQQAAFEAQAAQAGQVQEQLQLLQISKSSLQKDIEIVGQEKDRLESTRHLLAQEKENLAIEVASSEKNIGTSRHRLAELKTQDEAIRRSIAEKQGTLSGQEGGKAELAERVTRIKVDLAGLKQEEINYSHIMQRVNETIRDIQNQIEKKENQIQECLAQNAELEHGLSSFKEEIKTLTEQKGAGEEQLNGLRNEKQALQNEISDKEAKVKVISRELAQNREKLHSSEVKRARLEIEIDNSLNKLTEEFQLTYAEALSKRTEITNKKETVGRIKELKEAVFHLGNVNIGAIEEFQRVRERYDFLQVQYLDLEQAKASLFKVIAEMDQIMVKRFSEAFEQIRLNFTEVFTKLFGGGRAELLLTNTENLLECGVDIVAQPPGKKTQHLSLLSGGEKALTAIALLFAILTTKPSPFCVLDEIEAALDDANVDRFAEYLKEYAQNTQFIVITHRKRTMESADILYGVTMDESSVSKMVSMKMGDKIDKVS